MDWTPLLNDKIPDCGVAACGHAIQLWTGKAPSDADVLKAHNQFGALDGFPKTLRGWARRGIGGHHVGGSARIKPEQIPDAVKRFGCAVALMDEYKGRRSHFVLQTKTGVVSGSDEDPAPLIKKDILESYAIAPHWHPILLWWTLRNLFS